MGLSLLACSKDSKKAGLVVAIQSDMALPKDVDTVQIDVTAYGRTVFDQKYVVGKDELHIPGTLTILPADEESTPVAIRVISYHENEPLTLRRVVTTVPGNREAMIRMPIDWLCRGFVEKDGDEVVSTCGDQASCLAGACVPDEVDSSDLDDYVPGGVFGGKDADGKGVCFDTAPCFARHAKVADFGLNEKTCTFELSQSIAIDGEEVELRQDKLNFALKTESSGICGDWGCYVPLEQDRQSGFYVEDGTVHLPSAVCGELSDGAELVLTNACATRTPSIPPCGDWNDLDDGTITVPIDDLPPANTGGSGGTGGSASGGSPGSGGKGSGGAGTGGTATGGTGGGGTGTPTLSGLVWLDQIGSLGTAHSDSGRSIATDGAYIYVGSNTDGTFSGQTSAGGKDFSVTKLDLDGIPVWTRQYGSASEDRLNGIAVDSKGYILVGGYTYGDLSGTNQGGDAFVMKIAPSGAVQWVSQFGSVEFDSVSSLVVDDSDAIIVVGETLGALPFETALGGGDSFVRKMASTGAELWTDQYGTDNLDNATSVAVDELGNVAVAGRVAGALPGQTTVGDASSLDVYVRLYDAAGTELLTKQFGSSGSDTEVAVAVGHGAIYTTGTVGLALPGHVSSGLADVFLTKHDFSGNLLWSREVGSNLADYGSSIALADNGDVFVTAKIIDPVLMRFDGAGGSKLFELALEGADVQGMYVTLDAAGNAFIAGDTNTLLLGDHFDVNGTDMFVARVGSTENQNPFIAVSAGGSHTCGLREDGTVQCWGRNNSSQTAVVAGKYTAVTAGMGHTCALQAAGTVVCWGDNGYGQSSVPVGLTATSISAGTSSTCAVKTDKTVDCWGDPSTAAAEPAGNTFTRVSTGNTFACALNGAEDIVCWGSYGAPLSGPFRSLDLGAGHGCAIQSGGGVQCWGNDTYKQASPPGGTFTSVSGGEYNTCALGAAGVTCWGDNALGQSASRTGSYTAVSTGGYHTCALEPNGGIECWGDNSYGALNAP